MENPDPILKLGHSDIDLIKQSSAPLEEKINSETLPPKRRKVLRQINEITPITDTRENEIELRDTK